MATGTIRPDPAGLYSKSIESSGTSQFSILNKSFVKYGNLVIGSVRGQLSSASSTAMDLPLLSLNTYPPIASMRGSDNTIPCQVSIMKNGVLNSYSGLAWIKEYSGGACYLCQKVTSTMSTNDVIEIYFAYLTT